MRRAEPRHPQSAGDAPPFGRSWTILYLIVLGNLAFWITIFAVFARHFR